MKVRRVIGAADERSGGDVREAFAAGDVAVKIELLGRDVVDDRQVVRRRAEILAQRQDLAADFAQVVHRLEKFRFRFAQPEHDAALGDDVRCKFLRAAQDLERGAVFRARTHRGREPLDRLEVVIENLGRGVEHELDAPILRVKIGHEHFDDDRWIHLADSANGARKMFRAAVLQIIARDGGNDDVLELEPSDGFGDALRFVFFERERLCRW